MSRFIYPLPFGAQIVAPGRARFRIWAPNLDSLQLELHDGQSLHMERRDNGWFELECGADAGTRYRYRIAADLAVPDPASRLQCDDVHDWSVLIDPSEYHWQQPHWRGRPWHEAVIYELHVGCCGGFAAIENQLDEISRLGITALELMPIGDFSGKRNWGYDGVLPFAPDTSYGTPTQLKQLIDSAHAHGLCVYLDVVYNHFGPDGNYLHRYAREFFRHDKTTRWGDEIDFSQCAVREFFIQNALYWLHEYRFDGLRIDAAHAISDPGWLDEMAARVRASGENGRHIHLMLENEHNRAAHLARDFDAQWNDDWHNVMHVLLTDEREGYYANYVENPAQKLARSLAEGFIYQGELSPTHAHARGEPSAALPPTAFINFLQNHDQVGNRAFGERLSALCGEHNLRAAITLQLLMPAIPLLFMGEPWQTSAPFLFFTDFHGSLAEAVRSGRSKEFAAFEKFKAGDNRLHIPDPNALATFSASIPSSADTLHANNMLTFYQELLQLRHRHITPRLKNCRALGAHAIGATGVSAHWCFGDGKELRIAVNFGDSALPFPSSQPFLFASDTLLFVSNTFASDLIAAELIANNQLAAHCAVAVMRDSKK